MGIMNKLHSLKKYWCWERIKNNVKFLIKYDLVDEQYRLKDEIIEDCVYEYEELKKSLVYLKVLNEIETVKLLAECPKSFARYGDGEIHVMCGNDAPFQKYHPELARKMKDILIKKRENLYVGLNSSYFQSPTKYGPTNRKFYRLKGTEYRRFFNEICDQENIYLDACALGGYFRQGESFDIDQHYQNIRNLFKDKKICIVCGEKILDKLEYDLFDLSAEKTFIYAPKKNAFDEYDSILSRVTSEVSKDTLVCVVLGMTATVLVADLADEGYIAWDVGHSAKEYDAFMRKIEKSDKVINDFFAPD